MDALNYKDISLPQPLVTVPAPSLTAGISNNKTEAAKPRKPLWNPALDLTVATTQRSPRKGDTPESLTHLANGSQKTAYEPSSIPCSGRDDRDTALQRQNSSSQDNLTKMAVSTDGHDDKSKRSQMLSTCLDEEQLPPRRSPTLSNVGNTDLSKDTHRQVMTSERDLTAEKSQTSHKTRASTPQGSISNKRRRSSSPRPPSSPPPKSKHHQSLQQPIGETDNNDKKDNPSIVTGSPENTNHSQQQKRLHFSDSPNIPDLKRNVTVTHNNFGLVPGVCPDISHPNESSNHHRQLHLEHQHRLAFLASNILHMGAAAAAHNSGMFTAQHHHHHHHQPHLPPINPHYHHHPHLPAPPGLSGLIPHHSIALQNALAAAQSRSVFDKLSSALNVPMFQPNPATTPPNSTHPCHSLHPDMYQHLLQEQRQASKPVDHQTLPVTSMSRHHDSLLKQHDKNQQHAKPQDKENPSVLKQAPLPPSVAVASSVHHAKPGSSPHSYPPHHGSVQNALALAQSRAALLQGATPGQVLNTSRPSVSSDFLHSHPHAHHPHMLSPHNGSTAPLMADGNFSPVNPALGMSLTIGGPIGVGGGASGTGSYGRKIFPCPQCRYTTDRRNNLKRHMLTMHQTSSKMLECCGVMFSTKASLREHAMVFHYHGYTCYFCGRRFCRKALLKRHLSVHNGQKDFVCTVCDYATSHKSNLERHRKVHSRQDGDDERDGEEDVRLDDNGGYARRYHDDMKSNGSEAASHDDVSDDELSVCSNGFDDDDDDDIDVEINVHS